MLQMDTGGSFIDFLPSCSTASDKLFLNIILNQIAVKHTLLELLSFSFCNPKVNHISCHSGSITSQITRLGYPESTKL
jgi:hypothetical protein